MDKIKILDNKLRNSDSYDWSMNKIAMNFCGVFLILFMFLFMTISKDNFLLYMGLFLMTSSLADMNVSPYLYIKKGRIKLPIYKCLKETGISKKAFINSRIKYHLKFVLKIFIYCIAISLLGGIVFGKMTVANILENIYLIILCVVLGSISSVIDIYSSTKD